MDRKIFTSIGIAILSSLLASPQIFAEADEVKDTMYRDKTAEFNYETHSGVITLENYVPGEMKVSREALPLDAVLVLDFSGSMDGSYDGPDESYTRIVTDKMYCYYNFGSSSDGDSDKKAADVQNYVPSGYSKGQLYYTVGSTAYPIYIIRRKGTVGSTTYSRNWMYIDVDTKRYYVLHDGALMEAKDKSLPTFSSFPKDVNDQLITPTQGDDKQMYCTYKNDNSKTTSKRMYALEKAVYAFIDLVAAHAAKTGLQDRISIVQYQGNTSKTDLYYDIYKEGKTESIYVNKDKDSYLAEATYDYKFNTGSTSWTTSDNDITQRSGVLKHYIDLSAPNAVNALKHSITNMRVLGNTPTNAGTAMGKALMESYRRETQTYGGKTLNVAHFMVVFSDGEPTEPIDGGVNASYDDSEKRGQKAVNHCYYVKNTLGAKVYSIFCPPSKEDTDAAKKFMMRMSSDYPNATTCTNGTQIDEPKYYKYAKDDLAKVFEEIAQEILIEVSSKYDVNTTLNDFVNNEYFQLPEEVDQSTAYDNIHVFENLCSGYNKTTKEYSWSDTYSPLTQADGIKITITKKSATVTHDKIEISGYDYGKNWCGLDISKKTTEYPDGTPHGARLVVKIPFVYKTSQVWGDLPTNTDKSGVTVKDKETGEVKQDVVYPVPKLPFCYLTIQRQGLHKGESAIFLIEKPNSSGGYDFVDRVVVRGHGSGTDICNLYGVPGERFIVTETNWNWAYYQTDKVQDKTLDKTKEPYEIKYEFTGDHKLPDPSKSSHEQEVDPVNLHNHDEAFKVNPFPLPTKK